MSSPKVESQSTMSQSDIAVLLEKIESLNKTVQLTLQAALDRIARLEARMNGTADEPERGVIVRLDRVEQWKATAAKVIWMLVGCALTLGADRLGLIF